MDKCFLGKTNILHPDKCDVAHTKNNHPYCSLACNPPEHKELMTENKQKHRAFNRAFGK